MQYFYTVFYEWVKKLHRYAQRTKNEVAEKKMFSFFSVTSFMILLSECKFFVEEALELVYLYSCLLHGVALAYRYGAVLQ